jgi:hypothetical protein
LDSVVSRRIDRKRDYLFEEASLEGIIEHKRKIRKSLLVVRKFI